MLIVIARGDVVISACSTPHILAGDVVLYSIQYYIYKRNKQKISVNTFIRKQSGTGTGSKLTL